MQDQLVDESGGERLGHQPAAHQRDVLVACGLAGRGDRVLDAGRHQRLRVADLRRGPVAEDERGARSGAGFRRPSGSSVRR